MIANRRSARVNIRALVILVVVVGVLGVGVVVGHYVRKRLMANAALERGQAALAKEDWEEAAKELKLYLSKYPDDKEILLEYGQANLNIRPRTQDGTLRAIAAYRRLLRDHLPGDRETCALLAKLYFRTGLQDEVLFVCRQWLQAHPGDPDALLWRAKVLTGQRKAQEAEVILTELAAGEEGVDIEVFQLLGRLAMQSGGGAARREALAWLDRGVDANPQSPKAHVLRAYLGREAYHEASQTEEGAAFKSRALADLETATRLGTDDPYVRLMVCDEWIGWKEYDRAEAALKHVESVDETILDKYDLNRADLVLAKFNSKAKLAASRGRKTEMGALADAALAEIPETHRGRFQALAAGLYLMANRIDQAKESLEACRTWLSRPGGPGATGEEFLLLEARVAMSDNQTPERDRAYGIIETLNPIVATGPSDPVAYNLLAWANGVLGRRDEAIELRERYVERAGNDAQALLALANDYAGKDWERARHFAKASLAVQETLEAKLLEIKATLRSLGDRPERQQAIALGQADLVKLKAAHPSNVSIRVLLAELWEMQGLIDEAEAHLQRALAETSDPVRVSLALAAFYLRHDAQAKAVAVCERGIAAHPGATPLRLLLASLQNESGDNAAAVATTQEALAMAEGAAKRQAQDALVRYLLLGDDRESAIALLKQIGQERPLDVHVRLRLLAMEEIRANEPELLALIEEIKTIEQDDPLVDPDSCMYWKVERALWLLEQGDRQPEQLETHSKEIAGLLSPCAESRPGWEKPVIGLGALYELTGEYDRAEEVYRRCFDVNKTPGTVATHLLDLLERQGKYVEAQAILEQLPEGDEALDTRRIGIALGRGDYAEAIAELEEKVAAVPNNVDCRLLLARLVHSVHRDETRALALLDEAAALAPDELKVVSSRVAILAAAGRTEEAERIADAEVQRRADFDAYLLRARLHETIGNEEKAEVDYRHLTTFAENVPTGHILLAHDEYMKGRVDEAIATCEAALEIVPGNEAVERVLMEMLADDDDPQRRQRGSELLEKLLAANPNDPDLRRAQVQIALRDGGDPVQAEKDLRQVVANKHTDVIAWRQLITLVHDRGDLTEAQALIARALQTNPRNLDLLLFRARIESELGNEAAAVSLAKSACRMHPNSPEANLLLARLYLADGQKEKAADHLDTALALAPANEAVQMARSRFYAAMNMPDEAIDNLASYIDKEGGEEAVDAMLMLADLHLSARQFAPARARIEQAARLKPDYVKVAQMRVRLLSAQGQFDQVSSVVSAFPPEAADYVKLLTDAAVLLAASIEPAHWAQAREWLDKAVAIDAANVDVYLAIARVEYRRRALDQAVHAYKKVLELTPNHEQALNDAAWILAEQGTAEKLAEAELFANRAVQRHPNNPSIRDTRGVVLLGLGRFQEAKVDLERCLTLVRPKSSTHAKALMHLGQVLMKLEQPRQARARLEEALAVEQERLSSTPDASPFFDEQERGEINRLLSLLSEEPNSG